MIFLVGDRQRGRTTRLIEMAHDAEQRGEVNYIVVHNESEAYRVAAMAKRMDKTIGFPISYTELLQRRYASHHINHLYIDNVELLLQYLTHVPIKAVTVQEDNVERLA